MQSRAYQYSVLSIVDTRNGWYGTRDVTGSTVFNNLPNVLEIEVVQRTSHNLRLKKILRRLCTWGSSALLHKTVRTPV